MVCVYVKCVCMFISANANTLQELSRTSMVRLILIFGLLVSVLQFKGTIKRTSDFRYI